MNGDLLLHARNVVEHDSGQADAILQFSFFGFGIVHAPVCIDLSGR
jgi:hypothetical protein